MPATIWAVQGFEFQIESPDEVANLALFMKGPVVIDIQRAQLSLDGAFEVVDRDTGEVVG